MREPRATIFFILLVLLVMILLSMLSGRSIGADPLQYENHRSQQELILERDFFNKDRYNRRGKWGNRGGHIQRDFFRRDKWNVYDKWGNRKGSWERDFFNSDKFRFRRR